ncbi:MAG TPA: hypothetical protein VGJ15_04795 [Pirellulales bacterium]|jgi:hypothetical protein
MKGAPRRQQTVRRFAQPLLRNGIPLALLASIIAYGLLAYRYQWQAPRNLSPAKLIFASSVDSPPARLETILTIVCLLLLAALACLYGLLAYHYRWLPYRIARSLKLLWFSTPKGVPTDVESLISIQTPADVLQMRQRLCQFLWEQPDTPRAILPASVAPANDARWDFLAASVRQVDDVLFEMEFGLTSHVYHFIPTQPTDRLVLFHAGHEGDFIAQKTVIKKLLDQNIAVAAFAMPLLGLNSQPEVQLSRFGNLKLTSHDQMKLLDPKVGHPVKFFIEPVVGFLNYAAQLGYQQISMLGMSGGGWTTIVAAAVETRIKTSMHVAGAYPMFLRVGRDDWGDWEQTVPEFYREANYLELFILGAHGPGRMQCQIVNRYDPTCFAGDGWKTYAVNVQEHVAALGEGVWDIFVDESHFEHIVSDLALRKFLEIVNTNATSSPTSQPRPTTLI